MTRSKGGSWQLVSYAMTLLTWDCRKIQMSDHRDALVCENSDSHQGAGDVWYEMLTVKNGELDSQEIFRLKDSVRNCFPTEIEQFPERYEWQVLGPGRYQLRVDVRSGSKVLSAQELQRCHEKETTIPTTHFQLVFRFNGRTWQPGPRTAAALARIRSIQPREF